MCTKHKYFKSYIFKMTALCYTFLLKKKEGAEMVRHTVCFKLKDHSDEAKEKAAQVLLSMVGNVPSIRKIWVGTDFLMSDRSYDLILQVDLDNREALEEYQNDPYHCEQVKPYMHANREASVAVDCEF